MRYILLCLCPLLLFGNAREDEALFLNRIADFWEEGEFEIAKNQIQEFISLYPNSSSYDSLSSAIGDLFLKEKDYLKALASYEKITSPTVIERIFPHKLQCLYALKKYENIADECEQFLLSKEDLQVTYYLAISLYQQCLVSNEKESLFNRATPYFEKLLTSPLKAQIAAPYAHLLCMQKNFPKAAEIYLELGSDEMLFQAALIQAEYDKELSLKTFDSIKNAKPESAYNCLVLSFDLQKYEEIIHNKETTLCAISRTQIPMAHLFFGRSLFAMRQYSEASVEFEKYISEQTAISDNLHSALLTLLECAIQNKDLDAIENSIQKIALFYPEDDGISKGKFSKALIFRDINQFDIARQILKSLPETEAVLLELTYLCNQLNDYEKAREYALLCLSLDPSNSLAKKYFSHAVSMIANTSIEGKHQLINDLRELKDPTFNYLLAKTYFNLHEYQEALPLLLHQIENESDPDILNDLYLMSALCYRDGFQDLNHFCLYGEKTTSNTIHSTLFNAYLLLSDHEKAAFHLFSALKANLPISSDNLFWLAQHFITQGNTVDATIVLESMTDKKPEAVLALSKIYHQNHREEEAAVLLEGISELDDASLLLGEIYAKQGKIEEAQKLFAKVCQDSSSLKTYVGASACLQSMRLQALSEGLLSQYKNLILQKNISNEPLYLEAALDYVALQTQRHDGDLAKKIALLKKIKEDFENTEDLLSKDYHAARLARPDQDAVYQAYMKFLEAEIFETESLLEPEEQKELQAKAKDILLRIVEEKAHPALVERANQCLNP
ncbi:MAG TPA: tetratricopeptide repeat protein [Chlamydiales bacterium]|nr:tetratricopeptide repeat protein [Chlamydiales bacterium]